MGGGADEEWVNAAMTDDAMVVDLLVRLHRAPPSKPLEWSVRQRRSKPATARKPGRSSPTNPLSWSDATSASQDSTRPLPFKLSTSTRSKNNVDGEKTNSKRSRKKKTLAELKDEESSLLNERRELKREMAALRMNLERQRATHEKLKRMKIDLQPSHESTSVAEESVSGQQLQMGSTACDPTTTLTTPIVSGSDVPLQSSVSNARCNGNADAASGSKFILPDLNVPFDEPS
ncbi:uncharacterized protein LOC121807713 isoform X2 [Salvia splendens]|uniref:uncharacterized protein LOC121807713 isoform X2 n=1 Tax=Salvia splendens TaxID=180675 RepID=UPI001C28100A|nr:uncharacterized protein LOC121807713 isoform X2 [Salvia splendens]